MLNKLNTHLLASLKSGSLGKRIISSQFSSPMAQRSMSKKTVVGECYGHTMNDLPTPEGCWYAAYSKQQKIFNSILFGGIAFFLVSLITVSQCTTMNLGPGNIRISKEDFEDVL